MRMDRFVIFVIFALPVIFLVNFWFVNVDRVERDRKQSSGVQISAVNNLSEREFVSNVLDGANAVESSCVVLDDFDDVGEWRTVNDNVMGGRSLGSFTVEDSILMHRGSINTNGGGFSSVRRSLSENALVGYSKVRIRIDTGGRAYAVQFEDKRYRNVSHRYTIEAPQMDGWQEVTFDFDDTAPVAFGEEIEAEPFLAWAISSLRLSLNDGIDGPFDISVDWIKVCQ